MAGTISLSLSQRLDKDTLKPLSGGRLYFYAAGTTTPQNAFQDVALTIPHPNPIVLDEGGNIPQFFLADGQIKIRLTNSVGVVQIQGDNILVVGPSSGGGGGGGAVDATKLVDTGTVISRYGTGQYNGYVRMNARTIGSATSGASERANADCQPLFEYMWNVDSSRPVSGGRGASATADFLANKTLQLPDLRGRLIGGLGDMGNTDAMRLTAPVFGSSPLVLGAARDGQSITLISDNLPIITPTGNILVNGTPFVPIKNTTYRPGTFNGAANSSGGTNGYWFGGPTIDELNSYNLTFQGSQIGASQPFSILQAMLLMTFYIKL